MSISSLIWIVLQRLWPPDDPEFIDQECWNCLNRSLWRTSGRIKCHTCNARQKVLEEELAKL
jgi:hypothetical protein